MGPIPGTPRPLCGDAGHRQVWWAAPRSNAWRFTNDDRLHRHRGAVAQLSLVHLTAHCTSAASPPSRHPTGARICAQRRLRCRALALLQASIPHIRGAWVLGGANWPRPYQGSVGSVLPRRVWDAAGRQLNVPGTFRAPGPGARLPHHARSGPTAVAQQTQQAPRHSATPLPTPDDKRAPRVPPGAATRALHASASSLEKTAVASRQQCQHGSCRGS